MEAIVGGTVGVDENLCVTLDGLPTVWPKGFSAARDSSGRVTVRDAAGDPVAREGDSIRTDGGLATGPSEGLECVAGLAKVVYVQGKIEVVKSP